MTVLGDLWLPGHGSYLDQVVGEDDPGFIVEHVGLPRIERFYFMATQEPTWRLPVLLRFIYTERSPQLVADHQTERAVAAKSNMQTRIIYLCATVCFNRLVSTAVQLGGPDATREPAIITERQPSATAWC